MDCVVVSDEKLDGWLTLAEAAERYEVKRDRLRRATLEGRLPAHKVGTGTRMPWLVRPQDVEYFVRKSRRGRKRQAEPSQQLTVMDIDQA
jgi:excisionase family DNA binding protein